MRARRSSSVLPVLKWKAKARQPGSGTGSRVTADQNRSSAGTRKAISGSFTFSRRTTTPTESVAAIPIRASSEARSGKSARSIAAAIDGGTASDTTGAWMERPSASRTSYPAPLRRTSRTIEPVEVSTPGVAAMAAATEESPPSSVKLFTTSFRRGRFLKSEPGPVAGKESTFCEGTAERKGARMRE